MAGNEYGNKVEPEDRLEYRARQIVTVLAWVLPGPLVLWLFFRAKFGGLAHPDAMDASQIARHIMDGHGFVTSYIRPLALHFVSGPTPPDISQPPLFPLLLALSFIFSSPSDTLVTLMSGVLFLAPIPLIYVIGRRLFGVTSAVVATFCYVINVQILKYAISGHPVMLAPLLLTAALYTALRYTDPSSEASSDGKWKDVRKGLWLGVLLGASYLSWYGLVPAIAVLAWFGAVGSQRPALRSLGLVIGVLIICTPWLVRNYVVAGDPFFSLGRYELAMFTDPYPGRTLYRDIAADPPALTSFVVANASALVGRSVTNAGQYLDGAALLTGPLVLAMLFGSLFIPHKDPRAHRLTKMVFATLAATTFFILLGLNRDVLIAFVPAITVLAVGKLVELASTLSMHRRQAALAAFVFVMAIPVAASISTGSKPFYPAVESARELSGDHLSGQVVVSDVPWAVAWYSGRTCVWLPSSERDIGTVETRIGPSNLIYLSNSLTGYAPAEQVEVWREMYFTRKTSRGFAVARVYPEQQVILFARVADDRSRKMPNPNHSLVPRK